LLKTFVHGLGDLPGIAIQIAREVIVHRKASMTEVCAGRSRSSGGCTPASGWEKGQVENQVGLVRQRFFLPRLRFKNLDELNAWLLDKCIAYAKAHPQSGADRADDLGGVRGGAAEARSLCRQVRGVPRGAGIGLEDLPGALRQTIDTRWQPVRSVGRSRFMPMRIAS
jgi:hypothetical protein